MEDHSLRILCYYYNYTCNSLWNSDANRNAITREFGFYGVTTNITKPDGTTETLGPYNTDATGGTGNVQDQKGTNHGTPENMEAGDCVLDVPPGAFVNEKSFLFGGVDEFINFGDVLNFGANDFTISFWAKFLADDGALLGKGSFSGIGDFLITAE